MWGVSRVCIRPERRIGVRGDKSGRRKTGLEVWFSFSFLRDFKAAIGQQL